MVLAFAINGFGLALQVSLLRMAQKGHAFLTTNVQDAGANGFVVSMKDRPQIKMGILHAVYG